MPAIRLLFASTPAARCAKYEQDLQPARHIFMKFIKTYCSMLDRNLLSLALYLEQETFKASEHSCYSKDNYNENVSTLLDETHIQRMQVVTHEKLALQRIRGMVALDLGRYGTSRRSIEPLRSGDGLQVILHLRSGDHRLASPRTMYAMELPASFI